MSGMRTLVEAQPRPADEGKVLRSVLGRFATGVTVVAAGQDMPCGMTANSFTSVSVNPPLILVCVNKRAAAHSVVVDSGAFAVSVLSAGQEQVARYFANHSRPRGEGEFGAVGWSPARRTGSPILHGALAWLDCALTATYDGGDHTIFLGSVLDSGFGSESDVLLFFAGGFHRPELGSTGHT
jgi:flavin reductase